MKKAGFVFYWLAVFCSMTLVKGNEAFHWEPIQEYDWSVSENDMEKPLGAVMIFEKIVLDDRKLASERCICSIYRRLRILSDEGKVWGDVVVPILNYKQKAVKVLGRTVLREGLEIPLSPSQVYDKQVLQSKGLRLMQKSFSLPALTNDCIIEYYMEFLLPAPAGDWEIQKEIDLIYGELVWKFFKGRGLKDYEYQLLQNNYFVPNYTTVNLYKNLDVQHRPSLKEADEVVFTISDLKRFEPESMTLPDKALKARLRCFYGDMSTPASYWGTVSKDFMESLREFTKENRKVKQVVRTFLGDTIEDKMQAAYTWIQTNIKNIDYKEGDFKEAKIVDDVIKHCYGSSSQINFVFYDLLRELNVDAKILLTVDRDENYFDEQYKNVLQLDRVLVGVTDKEGRLKVYNPADQYLPFQRIGWYNEGTTALVVGEMNRQFDTIPISPFSKNQIYRHQEVAIDEELSLMGICSERNYGHPAHVMRLALGSAAHYERTDYIKNYCQKLFPEAKVDSFKLENIDNATMPVLVKFSLHFPQVAQAMGEYVVFKPLALFSKQDNPFKTKDRKHPIIFDYANEITEAIHVSLPDGWRVESLPEPVYFSNSVGQCQINCQSLAEGKELNLQYRFVLNSPFWKKESYEEVKQLFAVRHLANDQMISLKR